jgi:hypothetical protein
MRNVAIGIAGYAPSRNVKAMVRAVKADAQGRRFGGRASSGSPEIASTGGVGHLSEAVSCAVCVTFPVHPFSGSWNTYAASPPLAMTVWPEIATEFEASCGRPAKPGFP